MKNTMRLRDKMTLWYTALTFLIAGSFCLILYFLTANVLNAMLERDIRLAMSQVIAQIENENGLLTFEDEVPVSTTTMFFITEADGSELASYGEDITVFEDEPVMENVLRRVQGDACEWLLLDSGPIVEDNFTLRVRVAVSCLFSERVLSTLRLVFLIGAPFITLIALLGGFAIAKRSLLHIGRIINSANIISKGDLSQRVPLVHTKDELGELTTTLNDMLGCIENAFMREKCFTSDASHELRTPVAVMQAYTESLLAEPNLTNDQQDSLHTMLFECIRMQKIIGQLLTITRGQEGRYPICFETIYLDAIVKNIAETMAESLTASGIHFEYEISPNFEMQADQSLLTQMLLNLVENAVKYGKQSGNILMRASRESEQVVIVLHDDGIGISK